MFLSRGFYLSEATKTGSNKGWWVGLSVGVNRKKSNRKKANKVTIPAST